MTFSLKNFSGLLLDFDGTLGNTEPLHRLAMSSFFASKGYNHTKNEAGKSTLHIFREWGEKIGGTEKAEKFLREYLDFLPGFFSKHLNAADWQPDAEKFLRHTQRFPKVLVTGGFRIWLESFDPKLRIFDKFEHIITKEDVLPDHEKPDPLAYALGAKKLGLPTNRCVVLEDSSSGIRSAKAAGCFVIAVKRDSIKDFELADMAVDSLYDTL